MGFSVQEPEGKYTKSDRRIMDFVEDYTDEFLFMSIGQLAERLGMSEATVSRCARHLGYRDFKEMKNDLIQKKAGKGAAGKLAGTLMKDQGFDVENWFDFQRECLERTRENLDMGQFQEAVQCIGSARNIYIHAKNASLAAARLLFFRLRRLGFQASLIPSGGSEVLEGIAHAGEGDLIILFSFSKVSEEGRMILDYARETGCRTLAFTSRLYAPQEQRADVNLYVYRGEKEEFHTMSSAVAVIDALVLALSDSIQPKAAEELMRLQKLKKKYEGEKDVFIIGKTRQMELYMKACDIIYTKPGGLTSTEAAVSRIPIVHTAPIPGCESANRRFFVRHKMSIAPKSIEDQVEEGIRLLESPDQIQAMKEAQKSCISGRAAEKIADFLEEKLDHCEEEGKGI